ncbi:hypothetical protein R5R35_003858 [Gryllus longicercus]|uniref:EF-hand domain-containing protein n=1 Tax=Gryllus longicercus TaxID=2509291 RepID=A0AAN9V8C4_9ORTH
MTDPTKTKKQEQKSTELTAREERFIKFASVEYDGQVYMTPRDFLDAMIVQEPRPRLKRKLLSERELENIRKAALDFKVDKKKLKEADKMFHSLQNNGIVSYIEYLFLFSFLINPKAERQIVFNMFDKNKDSYVDKQEYLEMEKIFGNVWKAKRGVSENRTSLTKDYVDDETGLQRRHLVDTTLLIYFFGKDGKKLLTFEAFDEFISNLRTEVLEDEFYEFAKGMKTISPVDFIRALIRYSQQDTSDNNIFIKRVLEGVSENIEITFEDFFNFCNFLIHLNDFSMAARMSVLLNKRLSEEVFRRIIRICVDSEVNPSVIHTAFVAFDDKGNGNMNYTEFISVLRNRRNRLFKFHTRLTGLRAFKKCMREEIRKSTVKQKIA